MDAKDFLTKLDGDAIVQAIRDAEGNTSGKIRLFISRKKTKDALRSAQRRFVKMGLADTKARNSVFLYVSPRARKFAFVGDKAYNEICGDVFWSDLTKEVSACFRRGEFTRGVLESIQKVGAIYATHFSTRQNSNSNATSVAKG